MTAPRRPNCLRRAAEADILLTNKTELPADTHPESAPAEIHRRAGHRHQRRGPRRRPRARHPGDQCAGLRHEVRRAIDLRPAPRTGPARRASRPNRSRRPLDAQRRLVLLGFPADRVGRTHPGHRGLWPHWPGGGRTGRGVRHEGAGLRSTAPAPARPSCASSNWTRSSARATSSACIARSRRRPRTWSMPGACR